jgi:lysosomal alpha-mannosidase
LFEPVKCTTVLVSTGDLFQVHRRLLHDDAFGVGEALNETAFGYGLVAIGKQWFTGGNISSGTAAQRTRSLQQKLLLSPWLFFSPADNISFSEWVSHYKMEVR